ncbi:hypothetical protein [Limnochorda pilosa]|uniref:Uncharacterized protein n=1 Tax=Limnochorda pilosa TaxID=1555112 RepID=A0A0K2SGT6_LIMPI|nr:hypothetical protein [Limnochorda pilosa]BAS26326.1 hypothetical protein LIP_0469 [Limnochorda pilosa]
MLVLLLLASQGIVLSDSGEGAWAALQSFLSDPRAGTSEDGLVVIRNFVTGGLMRGKNVRYHYARDEVPVDGSISVPAEDPYRLSGSFFRPDGGDLGGCV